MDKITTLLFDVDGTIRATYGFHNEKMHEPEQDFFINDISELLNLLK